MRTADTLNLIARERGCCTIREEALNGFEGAHLGPKASFSVKAVLVPSHAALGVAIATRARVAGSLSRRDKPRSNLTVERRHHDGALPHEAGEEALESGHVSVAVETRLGLFASAFVHDAIVHKEPAGTVEELGGAISPLSLTSIVVEDSGTVEHDAAEVGKGCVVNVGARVANANAIVDAVSVVVNQVVLPHPVPSPVGPIKVRLLASDAIETGRELEEAAIADGVLVCLTIGIAFENLPIDTAITVFGEPAACKLIKDIDANIEPRGQVAVGLGKVALSGGQDVVAPEEEIVISFFISMLRGHIVVVWSEIDLGEKGLEDDIVVGGVLGVVIVVEHGAP